MRRQSLLIALAAIVPAAGAQPQDALVASVSQSAAHDSNLLRLPDGADPGALTGRPERSDTVARTAAGLAFDREFGRQRLRGAGFVDAYRYANHRQFDSEGYRTAGGWDWVAGSQWYGDATLRAERLPASFTDSRTGRRNLIDLRAARLGAGYRLDPRWSVVGAAEALQVRNSDAALAGADFRDSAFEVGARFAPGTGTDAAVVWRRGEGRFTGAAASGPPAGGPGVASGAGGYRDDRLLLRLAIEPNDISRIAGEIGYTRRRYDDAARGEFRGLTYAVEYLWRRGGALSVGAYLRRDAGAGSVAANSGVLGQIATAQVLVANYADSRYFGLRPSWQPTAKLRFNGQLEYIDRRFGTDAAPAGIGGGAQRQDKLHAFGLSMDYELLRKLWFTAFARQERRSSTRAQFDFDATVVGAGIEFRF